jgi:co-chaperonin GroES (HSP10)
MKIKATGPLVVLRKQVSNTYKNSIIAKPDAYENRENIEEQIGQVFDIGPSCWYDEPHPRCKVGDHVIYERYQGHWIKDEETGDFYKFLNDRDILGIVEEFETKEVK